MSAGATVFATTADAAAYVPYADAERVLASLEEWSCDVERPMRVLRGPSGSGKSMLLAVLAARVGRHAVPVRMSANGLDPETLARTVLDALGTWEGTPRVALLRAVEQLGTRRVLLLLDDAEALVPRTEMWLFDLVRRSAGAVRVLLAVRDERLADEYARAFQAGTTVLALDAPMSREEADTWVRAELARGGADAEMRARFDAATLARLHSRSGGVPGRLRQEAAAIVAEFAARGGDPQESATRAMAEVPPPQQAAAPPRRLPDLTGVPAAAPPSPSGAKREPGATHGTPRARALARAAAAAREASARGVAGAAAGDVAPTRLETTRSGVDPESARWGASRRDGMLRWLLVPAALAAAYVAGFLTAQMLERGLPTRIAAETPAVAVPSVSAAPPQELEAAATQPSLPPAAAPSEPVTTRSAAEIAAATPAAVEPAATPELAQPPDPAASSPAPAPTPPDAGATADAPSAVDAAPPAAAAAPPDAAPVVAPPAVAAASPPARVRRAQPQRRNVEVNVEAEPGSTILVNGQAVGSGTAKELQLPPGPHLLEVRLPDGRSVQRVINVEGSHYDVKVR